MHRNTRYTTAVPERFAVHNTKDRHRNRLLLQDLLLLPLSWLREANVEEDAQEVFGFPDLEVCEMPEGTLFLLPGLKCKSRSARVM